MSHQTGIRADQTLRNFFAVCKSGHIRIFKVSIKHEQLVLDGHHDAVGSLEHDYDSQMRPMFVEEQPCYFFIRLDSMNTQGYEWLFISYSPDDGPVKQKMLYASTKATLKQEFGAGQIKDEIFGTTHEETCLAGYQRYLKGKLGPKPLSQAEEELLEVKKQESGGIDVKRQTVQGVSFPITDKASTALSSMKQGRINYAQFSIDTRAEIIDLEKQKEIDVRKLASLVPMDQPRYHLFNFKHDFEGTFLNSLVFVYSMPGHSCPIRQRMLYSSCKAPFLDVIEHQFHLPIAKRVEIDDGKDLTADFLYEELHPQAATQTRHFSKPQGPGGRGPRRIIK